MGIFVKPDQIRGKIAGSRAAVGKRLIVLIMNKIRNEVILNLSGKVLKVRTGRLRGSIATSKEVRPGVLRGRIGTNVFYGKTWEEDGRPEIGLPPRPFIKPAIEKKSIQAFIVRQHEKSFKGSIEGFSMIVQVRVGGKGIAMGTKSL